MRRGTTALMFVALGCAEPGKPDPTRDVLRQPTGLAMSPEGRWLFVSGGNWDQRESGGTLMALDLEALHAALARPGDVADGLGQAVPCRFASRSDTTVECDPSLFIRGRNTVLLGDGVGNIAIDRPSAAAGAVRLLLTQRRPAAVVWVDLEPQDNEVGFACGQDEDGRCDDLHTIVEAQSDPELQFPGDPSRIVVDEQGYRFAYVPALLGGAVSLIDLDGDRGPELSAVQQEFFRESPFEDFPERGGFSVAQRPCDPQAAPDPARECTRPYLFATHRYWPGLRAFTIAPGLELVLPGIDYTIAPLGSDTVESRPFMGDLEFEDPDSGDALLVVQTTPSGLARLDTSLDDEGLPRMVVEATVPVCDNPNQLAVHRPEGEEWLALVTCFGDGALTVVSLGSFSVIRTIELGAGANEMVVDTERRQVYVANTNEHTISIVSLERTEPRFLTEWARLGLGVERNETSSP